MPPGSAAAAAIAVAAAAAIAPAPRPLQYLPSHFSLSPPHAPSVTSCPQQHLLFTPYSASSPTTITRDGSSFSISCCCTAALECSCSQYQVVGLQALAHTFGRARTLIYYIWAPSGWDLFSHLLLMLPLLLCSDLAPSTWWWDRQLRLTIGHARTLFLHLGNVRLEFLSRFLLS